jgi:DNA repair protein RadC
VGSLGPSRVARLGAALELGRRIAALSTTSTEPVGDSAEVARRLIPRYAHRVQETFGAIFLDSRNRIVSEREIFIGTLNSADACPRDVFRPALHDHAASVIVFHNQPSGDPSPSPQDIVFTTRLAAVGEALGVAVLDHLVMAGNAFVSFKQRGLL